MDVKIFIEAVREELSKICTAFITWGLGIMFMISYCLFLVWIQTNFGLYATIISALLYLSIAFFFVDLWWNYNRVKHLKKMKDIG